MNIQINYLRLSFIWVETVVDLIADSVPSDAPLAFLGRPGSYIEIFDRLLPGGTGPRGLEMPWPTPSGQFFWTYYLEGRTPGYVSGKQAWKALVPFRKKLPIVIEAPGLPGQSIAEAFFYPHGVALILTVLCRADLSLEEAVEGAFEVRRKGKLRIEWQKDFTDTLTLDSLADRLLTALRRLAIGPTATPGHRSITPFSLFTVVRGTGVAPSMPMPHGGEVHRALEAVTTWRPTWRFDALPNLDDVTLPTRTAPPSHVLYAHTRGRAIWFPGSFTQQGRNVHSLTCYHGNLTFASLQVESLGSLIVSTARQIHQETGRVLSPTHLECARRAAGILGRFYGGSPSIYQSFSPRTQTDQNNLLDSLNTVRDYFNMKTLP